MGGLFNEPYNDTYKKYNIGNEKAVYKATFSNNGESFSMYSYESDHARRYFIVDNLTNTIVYDSPNSIVFIDAIYSINEMHNLLIENSKSSTTVPVYTIGKDKKWKIIEAFKGEGFGFNGAYINKSFREKRKRFTLDYRTASSYLIEIEKIFFNTKTKILSYLQYSDKTHYKEILSEWKNNRFEIDHFTYEDPTKTHINLKIYP